MPRRALWVLCLPLACASESDPPPNVEVTPSMLEFGDLIAGDSVTRTITVKNAGSAPFTFDTVSIEGSRALSAIFSSGPIAPGASSSVGVTYAPEEADSMTAIVHLAARGHPIADIPARGSAIEGTLAIEPSTLDFGTTLIGVPVSREATIINQLSSEVEVQLTYGESVEGCTAPQRQGQFCVREPMRFTLGPRAQKTVTVEFSPAFPGVPQGWILFSACAGCPATRLVLMGFAAESPIRCDPPAIEFGASAPGRCVDATLVCTTATPAPAEVIGWELAEGSSNAFTAVDDQLPRTLQPGEIYTQVFRFCPENSGDHWATANVRTEPAGWLFLSMHGTGGGPAISVSPPELDFGPSARFTAKKKQVAITNSGGGTLEVSVRATDNFQVDRTRALISIGETDIIEVGFLPSQTGPLVGTLFINSNDASLRELRVPLRGEGIDLPECNLTGRPFGLEFGVIRPGERARRVFELENLGDEDCELYEVELRRGVLSAFTLVEPLLTNLPARGLAQVIVELEPQFLGIHMDTLDLVFATRSAPVSIPLTAVSAHPELFVEPTALDFGAVGSGCASRTETVRFHNLAPGPIDVNLVQLIDPITGFELTDNPATDPIIPFVLPSGETASFDVTFRPSAVRPFAGAITIDTNRLGNPAGYVVSLEGTGAIDPRASDHFQQLGSSKADVLFVIDNAPTMADEQAALVSAFPAFLDFASGRIDYRIAATTLDESQWGFGLFHPTTGPAADRVIVPGSPAGAFATIAAVGATGTGPRMGLRAFYEALREPNLSGHNTGFLRDDASLAVIVVSDHADASAWSADFYADFLAGLKARRDQVSFSAITGGPSGCEGAEPDARYTALAEMTGGLTESICTTDWPETLRRIAPVAFGRRTRFELRSAPIPATLEVRVDGALTATTTWSHDPATNTIIFSESTAPADFSELDISYDVACL